MEHDDNRAGAERKEAGVILVTARMKLKDGARDAFDRAVAEMLAPSRAEAGCMSYDVTVDVGDPSKAMFVERWTNRAALNAHFEKPHFVAFQQAIGDLIAEPPEAMIHHVSDTSPL